MTEGKGYCKSNVLKVHSPVNAISESLPCALNEMQKNSNGLAGGFRGRSRPQMSVPQTSHISLEG